MPIDGDWRPGWALLETSKGGLAALACRRVPYDLNEWVTFMHTRTDHPEIDTPRGLERYRFIFEHGAFPGKT